MSRECSVIRQLLYLKISHSIMRVRSVWQLEIFLSCASFRRVLFMLLGVRRGIHLGDLPKHFTDLKMDGSKSSVTQTQLIDLQLNLAPGQTNAQKQMQQAILRRDSNSTVSTYYGSMCSGELGSSRRSSQVSQVFS
jgi:hypothetical protein